MKRFCLIFQLICLIGIFTAPAYASDITVAAQTLSSLSFNPANLGIDRQMTATATNGSTIVTSTGAFPPEAVGIGGFQILIGGTQYVVASVQSTSSLTLKTMFVGMTGSQAVTWYKWVLFRVYNTSGFAWQPLGSAEIIQPGSVDSGLWYRQIACSVINPGSGNVLWIPEFIIPATIDSPTNNSAKYSFVFYGWDKKTRLNYFTCGNVTQFSVSTSTPTTLAAICNYNQAPIQNQDHRAYSIAQIDARLKSCLQNNLYFFAQAGNVVDCLTVGSGLSIAGGVLTASGGGGGGMAIGGAITGGIGGRLLYVDAGGNLGQLSTVTSNGTAVAFAAGALSASNIINGAATLTLPITTDQLVGRLTTDNLSNKTLITPTIASLVNANHNHQNSAGGGTLDASAIAAGTLSLARGGTGASLVDPNADRILFWDDSAGQVTFLTVGSGLSIAGTTLSATGGGGGSLAIGSPISGATPGRLLYVDVAGNLGEISGVTSDGTNTTFASSRLRTLDPWISGVMRGVLGNRALALSDVSSAVNYVVVAGGAPGTEAAIFADGTDTNIDLSINSKNTGVVRIYSDLTGRGTVRLNDNAVGNTTVGNTSTLAQLTVLADQIGESALRLDSHTTSSSPVLIATYNSVQNNAIREFAQFHMTSGGSAPAAGFGAAIRYGLETDLNVGSTSPAAQDKVYWKDAANATASSIREFWSMDRAIESQRHIIAPSKSVADNVVTAIFTVAVPTGGMVSGVVILHTEATDGTDFQSRTATYQYAAVNKAGTLTVPAPTIFTGSSIVAISTGTLGLGVTAAASGTNMEFRVQADTSLTASPRVWFTIIPFGNNAPITITP